MSSGSYRDVPTGIIQQGNKIVGSIVMPEADDIFIREFNHCYGQLRLSVAALERDPAHGPSDQDPHTFRLPLWFRHVWHSVHPAEESDPPPAPDHGRKSRSSGP